MHAIREIVPLTRQNVPIHIFICKQDCIQDAKQAAHKCKIQVDIHVVIDFIPYIYNERERICKIIKKYSLIII